MRQIDNNNGAGISQAVVVHHIAGRMRVRVDAAKRNPERVERIRESMSNLEGVHDVTANPALGTLIVHYEPELFGQVIQRLNEQGAKTNLFTVRTQEPDPSPPVTRVDRGLDKLVVQVNTGLGALTGETMNLKEIVPFSILLYALFFVDKAIGASQWLSWIQFAFGTYMDLHQEEPVAKVGESVEALRAEVHALREELLGYLKKEARQARGE